jgi:hypothetical protein
MNLLRRGICPLAFRSGKEGQSNVFANFLLIMWNGIQDIGKGVQNAAKSASADTALRVLYQHQAELPGTVVQEAEAAGRVIDGRAASVYHL